MASMNRGGVDRCARGCRVALGVAGGLCWAGPALGQCSVSWQGLGNSGAVRALCVFDDDGAGPRPASIFVGGDFTTFRGIAARRIARLTGGECSPAGMNVTGGGFNGGSVRAMAVFDDDGPGPNPPSLYVGGQSLGTVDAMAHSGVAKWDGATWSSVGSANHGAVNVFALCVFDEDGDGPGLPALIAGGTFSSIGGVSAQFVAKWDGAAWSALGSGPTLFPTCMTTFDEDGEGPGAPALFTGSASSVQRWGGGTWSNMSSGLLVGPVNALIGWDPDGAGPAPVSLYLARTSSIGDAVCRWTGTTWEGIGPAVSGGGDDGAAALAVVDLDGAGADAPRLLAGFRYGGLDPLDDADAALKWFDGAQWNAVSGWPRTSAMSALLVANDGHGGASGPILLGGGGQAISGTALVGNTVFRMGVGTTYGLDAPADVSASVGGSASFHVGWPVVADAFQWRRGGVALTDGGAISGATTATLTINPVSEADEGVYECVVTTPCAVGITRPAALAVAGPEPCPVDTNGDDVIDFLDLNGVLSLFGLPCP